MKRSRFCKNCEYFLKSEGECHRYPPQVAEAVFSTNYADGGSIGDITSHTWYFFPEVREDYWCGEFKVKGGDEEAK